MPKIQYFLGGNTPSGFYSLYHQLSDPDRFRAVYIIKGGPGSGKSTLMRRVERHAQAAGLEAEEVLCSGDPDSLDAVIFPALGAAIVDGTAPQGVVPKGHLQAADRLNSDSQPFDPRARNLKENTLEIEGLSFFNAHSGRLPVIQRGGVMLRSG